MNGTRSGSWEDAARHPSRTLGLPVLAAAVIGIVSYYDGWTPRSAWGSALIGVGCGAILVRVLWRGMSAAREGQPPEVIVPPLSLFSLLVGLAGVGIAIWGFVVGDWALAVSGLPLALLGAALIAVRWWLNRRTSPSG